MRFLSLLALVWIGFPEGNKIAAADPEVVKINEDLEIIRVSPQTLIVISYTEVENWGRVGSNSVLLVQGDKGFLIDTPMEVETTRELLDYLESEMNVWLVGFLAQHWHHDSMGGLAVIQNRHIPNYAANRTRDIARERGLPVPEIGFDDKLDLPFGERELQFRYCGPAHTSDGVVVWLPDEQILIGGCALKSQGSRNLGNLADADLEAYPETMKRLWEEYGDTAEIVIPGHGPAGGPTIIQHNLQMALELP